jgi:hypothetical protein
MLEKLNASRLLMLTRNASAAISGVSRVPSWKKMSCLSFRLSLVRASFQLQSLAIRSLCRPSTSPVSHASVVMAPSMKFRPEPEACAGGTPTPILMVAGGGGATGRRVQPDAYSPAAATRPTNAQH